MPDVKLVPVQLDRERNIRVDFNALELAEELTGKDLMGGELDNPRVGDVKKIVFAFLKHEDPELTLDAVGGMLHPGNINEVTAALKEAMRSETRKAAAADDAAEEASESGKAESASTS